MQLETPRDPLTVNCRVWLGWLGGEPRMRHQFHAKVPESELCHTQGTSGSWLGKMDAKKRLRVLRGLWAHSTQPCPLPCSTDQNDTFKTSADEWVLLNLNVTGYYQVNYDEGNWKKIQNQLQTDLSVRTPPALFLSPVV